MVVPTSDEHPNGERDLVVTTKVTTESRVCARVEQDALKGETPNTSRRCSPYPQKH